MSSRVVSSIAERLAPTVVLVALLWAVQIVNFASGQQLNVHGLVPRTGAGALAIVWAPFLHAGFNHLISNTAPLLVLGVLVSLSGRKSFGFVTVFVVVASGAAVWVIGRHAVHVGASGLLFGYFGYLLARAWLTRTPTAAIIAVVTGVLYSGMIWGVLPQEPFISWEFHLCGLLSGVVAAKLLPAEGR